jgi:hypothetical protein
MRSHLRDHFSEVRSCVDSFGEKGMRKMRTSALIEIDKIPDSQARLLLILAQDMPILSKEEQQVSVVRTEFNERG